MALLGGCESDCLEDGGGGGAERPWRLPRRALCCAGVSVALASALVFGTQFHYIYEAPPRLQPTWEVMEVAIRHFDFPPLMMSDLVAADTSRCPSADPCGVATAKDCSRCPHPGMWNAGCVCKKNGGGTPAPPGTVIQSNMSGCPSYDRCGMASARGCSTCPDASWANEGCTCRQPLSARQFFEGLQGVAGLLLGLHPDVIKIGLRATVEVHNPAPIPATTEDGTMNVRYRNVLIGSAALRPLSIGPRSSATLVADVSVDNVPQTVGLVMLQELVNHKSQINIVVEGSVKAKAASVISVTCKTECHLRTDVSAMPKPTFSKKECTYTYIN